MILRGIDFGKVTDASGVRGFFGEGYPHHRWWKPFGLDFAGSTFVAKTTTLDSRSGNMPLNKDLSPKEMLPKCVVVKPLRGVALNAVGLSGPGAMALFKDGRWQRRTDPFFLSFMSVQGTAPERLRELNVFVELLRMYLPYFRAPVGLQINFSCPNVGLHADNLAEEAMSALTSASKLGIPLMPKFNVLLPPDAAKKVSEHRACDALCVSNTLPWGALPDTVDWVGLFGSATSPLAAMGGGGLSGKPLLPLTELWVRMARRHGVTKPINAGGGILSADDAARLLRAGADSVFIGTAAIIRPWRVRSIIRAAKLFRS